MSCAVTVRFFAALREQAGTDRLDLDLDPADVERLRAALTDQLGGALVAELFSPPIRIALNQDLVAALPARLAVGDEIAFLPPVTGG